MKVEDLKKRNYGIDMLRILSMFFVVLLHSLGRGGIIYNADVNSLQYKISWLLEIIAYCAVDIFALISGYVAYSDEEKKVNYTNYVILWLEVVFYGILITFLFDISGLINISLRDYVIVLAPVSNGLYWYFTAYTGLFILMPIINNAIRNTSKDSLKKIFMLILLIFSMFDNIVKRFYFDNGYAFVWLLILYIMGQIIKKCEIGKHLKNKKIIGGMFILTLITYLYKIYGFDISILNITITKDWFISYTSPTILVIAVLYIILFSRIKLNKKIIKIVKFAAPSSFAIYVLNNHRLVWDYIMNNIFIDIANDKIIKVILYPIIFSILFSIMAILIDKGRQLLFKKLNIKRYLNKIFIVK